MRSKGLGYLEKSRLKNLPLMQQPEHEFCFYLHDSMLNIFQEVASHRYPSIEISFDDEQSLARFKQAPDPISYFLSSGDRHLAKQLSVGQAMMAVWSDFFNFIYEALTALEKRKFVVAYALLRKPLKENLLLLTIMLADEDHFFNGLEAAPSTHFSHPGLQDTHRKAFFTAAKAQIPFGEFVDPEVLHDIIFDVGHPNGLAPLFDKATHLVTSRHQIRTENLNLNFIFKNPNDNDVYESIYRQLAYILLYAMFLEMQLFRKAGFESEKLSQWFSLTAIGTYSALFSSGRPTIVTAMNRLLAPFLTCPHCDASVRINRRGAARFFCSHKLHCSKCKREHDFPLFWLMSKTKWSIHDDGLGLDVAESNEA